MPVRPGDQPTATRWLLFADWCAACERDPLPADPDTVAEFLADHPAQPDTQRRRVAVINAAHRDLGLTEPGRAHAVQQALASRRAQRLQQMRARLTDTIAALPTAGWPHGLFGRRDALILTLVAAGLTFTEIAALCRGDLRCDGATLLIESRRQWRLDDPHPGGAVAVYARWAQVQALLDRYASTRMVARYLDRSPEQPPRGTAALAGTVAAQPLIVSIDRWGYTPLVPTPMTEQSIATVTRAHLDGRAPSHRPPADKRPPQHRVPPAPDRVDPVPAPLDSRSHHHGIAARRAAHTELAAAERLLDEVATRAERLLEQLAAIVDDAD